MSASPRSRAVAGAIVDSLGSSARSGQRYHASSIHGVPLAEVLNALLELPGTSLGISPGPGKPDHLMRAVTLPNGSALLPYLIDTEGVATPNSGSSGFAATLRTQFEPGTGRGRTLLLLGEQFVETVRSAAEDASNLPELSFPKLAARVALIDLQPPEDLTPLMRSVVRHFGERGAQLADRAGALATLHEFVMSTRGLDEAQVGRRLFELGTYLSDPECWRDPDKRLKESWKWRADLDTWTQSSSASLESRLRGRSAPDRGMAGFRAVLDASTPFGIDYSSFTLSDLQATGTALSPLRLSEMDAIIGSRFALRGPRTLLIWMPSDGGDVRIRLSRPAEPGEQVLVTFNRAGASAPLDAARSEATVTLLPDGGDVWRFGWIETRRQAPRGLLMERLALAVAFTDGDAIAFESSCQADPATASFVADAAPRLTICDESGELGSVDPEGDEDNDEAGPGVHHLTGSIGAAHPPPVPVSVQESDADEDEADPEEQGASADRPIEVPSIPHWWLRWARSGVTAWPLTRVSDDSRDIRVRSGPQNPQRGYLAPTISGIADGDPLRIEAALLGMPEGAAYAWDPEARSLSEMKRLPSAQGAEGAALARLGSARQAFFLAAREAGSVYAIDPRCSAALEYVSAYDSLLAALPRDGLPPPELATILQLDLVQVTGSVELLLAPTSPLAVAFHAELARRCASWIESGDLPQESDLAAISLRHSVPLLHHSGDWYEAAAAPHALLWRRYVLLASSAPGALDRNSQFIRRRLEFFLEAHPVLASPACELAVTFADVGDGSAVLDALRAFYEPDLRREDYSRPRLAVTLIGNEPSLDANLAELLSGGRGEDEDRLVQARCSITRPTDRQESFSLLPFSLLSFLFRSPGERRTRPVRMADRSTTAYLGGLACAPGRLALRDANPVFATGTFCSEPGDADGLLLRILYRSLELAGGQAGELLQQGFTRMPVASLRTEDIDDWYQRSAWVVHLDRMVGLEAFVGDAGVGRVIEYEERADPEQPGYDGITATRRVRPYHASIQRALRGLQEVSEDAAELVVRKLESVSGRWALQLVRSLPQGVRQHVGTACALDELDHLERVRDSSVAVATTIVALDEVVRGFPSAGVPQALLARRGLGAICDDLLVLQLIDRGRETPPLAQATPVEVKFDSAGEADYERAATQVISTRDELLKAFGKAGPARPFRGRDLAELIRSSAARNAAFGFGSALPEAANPLLDRMAQGDYEVGLGHWRSGERREGMVIAVETQLARGGPALVPLPAPGGIVDLVRLGAPFLSASLAGGYGLPSPRSWPRLSLVPPDAPDAGGSQEPGAGPSGGVAPEPGETPAPPPRGAEPALRLPRPPRIEGELARVAGLLDAAFARYGLAAEPFDPALAQVGPSVLRMRTRALGRLSITEVERRARDISREIHAPGEVLVGDEPGFVTIDVPRAEREPVPLGLVLPTLGGPGEPGALDFVVGVAPSGLITVADLARLPHLLVAGATGSGKSVFLRGLLVELLRARTPDQLQIVIIDPKRLDFTPFARTPHLRGQIIFDPAQALETLRFTLEAEIEWRQPILEAAGVSSATEYYESGGRLEDLTQLVIVVDEFADLVLAGADRRAFSELIQRYAQLTRAFGVYLVLATQRPSVDVVTGSIKANLTARIAFSLPSATDSRTVIDRGGAEDLLGHGDLLFYRSGRVERLQGPLTTLADVRDLLRSS